ncbi:hypothetical protein [Mesorhizobium salmacidum]|uniref:Uncharacterized protein n=1 Tax=Mesorhizobium salmacidum TaxID=3015171 RepID=A0ABU8L2W4_9HYPH
MDAAGDKRLLAIGDVCWDVANFLRPAGGAAEQGERVLVLSGWPEKGHVAGAFARIMRNASDQNYAANSYDATKTVSAAIHALAADGRLSRANVADAIRSQRRQGIAYPEPIEWDQRGGNLAAVTALHVVKGKTVQTGRCHAQEIALLVVDAGLLLINVLGRLGNGVR